LLVWNGRQSQSLPDRLDAGFDIPAAGRLEGIDRRLVSLHERFGRVVPGGQLGK
jgi:hypothetical protein